MINIWMVYPTTLQNTYNKNNNGALLIIKLISTFLLFKIEKINNLIKTKELHLDKYHK